MKPTILPLMLAMLVCQGAHAQVNSGSNGSDGAFNPTTNTVINMADHPTGIYQYTSVNIPNGVIVTFIPNANNTPVYWLVQSNVVINGTVDLSGKTGINGSGGAAGPGGFKGGNGGTSPSNGEGPGGGFSGTGNIGENRSASYGTLAQNFPKAPTYGNVFLLPLLGGSGGGGLPGQQAGGGGGGGAILIAASGEIQLNGAMQSSSGSGQAPYPYSGGGSGGAVRLLASKVSGSGMISVLGWGGGYGRIRIDTLDFSFGGTATDVFTRGFQPIILQEAGQGAQLTVTSVGGVPVFASPTGQLSTPDAVLSAQQNNPIPVVVSCANLPLNTQITVSVKPANGATVSATGLNNNGTLASSTATVSIVMPRGGGLIYATAATGN